MIGFTGADVDRADHLRLDEDRLAALAAQDGARMMRLDGLDPVLDGDGRLAWEPLAAGVAHIFLGLRDDLPLFAPLVRVDNGAPRWSVFGLLAGMAGEDAALWGGARSLNEWHRRHLGLRAQPQRMAQSPPFLRHLRRADRELPRRLGPPLHRLQGGAFPARRSGGDHARRT